MYGRFPSEDEEVRLGLEMDVPMWMTVVDRERSLEPKWNEHRSMPSVG